MKWLFSFSRKRSLDLNTNIVAWWYSRFISNVMTKALSASPRSNHQMNSLCGYACFQHDRSTFPHQARPGAILILMPSAAVEAALDDWLVRELKVTAISARTMRNCQSRKQARLWRPHWMRSENGKRPTRCYLADSLL